MSKELSLHAGRWVAVIAGKVVGHGGTPEQAALAAETARFKESPEIIYVPTVNPITFPSIFYQVCELLPAGDERFLVGGSIRDALLNRPIHDFDIILGKGSLRLARKVADHFGGAYFPLDQERETARLILKEKGLRPIVFDFAQMRGNSLDEDLLLRDFTINAIAISLAEPDKLLDPLGGQADLVNRTLRVCSRTSFNHDPVRILRAIRLATAYDLKIHQTTKALLIQAIPSLVKVSPERIRDELFRILDSPKPTTSILALEILGVLPHLLPELPALKDVSQSDPHRVDVWSHTLDTLKYLEILLQALFSRPQEKSLLEMKRDSSGSALTFLFHLSARQLGRFRKEIASHLTAELVPERCVRSLLFFAALYHDSAKPSVQTRDTQGRFKFENHEQLGGDLVAQRGVALRLSNNEIDRLKKIVKGHMRPTHLARQGRKPTSLAIYRYFRELGEAGIDISILSLADLLAAYGPAIPLERWRNQLDVVENLMEAWWQNHDKIVNPNPLLDGEDLLQEFNLKPGPMIGRLLELLREGQVEGRINTRQEALRFIKSKIALNDES